MGWRSEGKQTRKKISPNQFEPDHKYSTMTTPTTTINCRRKWKQTLELFPQNCCVYFVIVLKNVTFESAFGSTDSYSMSAFTHSQSLWLMFCYRFVFTWWLMYVFVLISLRLTVKSLSNWNFVCFQWLGNKEGWYNCLLHQRDEKFRKLNIFRLFVHVFKSFDEFSTARTLHHIK